MDSASYYRDFIGFIDSGKYTSAFLHKTMQLFHLNNMLLIFLYIFFIYMYYSSLFSNHVFFLLAVLACYLLLIFFYFLHSLLCTKSLRQIPFFGFDLFC